MNGRQLLTSIPRPENSPRADLYPCHICPINATPRDQNISSNNRQRRRAGSWGAGSANAGLLDQSIIIGWAKDFMKICIRPRNRNDLSSSSSKLIVELVFM